MTMTDIQNLLTGLMRGIDKKTALTVEPRSDPNQSAVTVHLSRDKRSASVQFSETDLIAGQTDLLQRNRLRASLKRARDRMWQETGYIFTTKMAEHKMESSWSRPPQGGRGRR